MTFIGGLIVTMFSIYFVLVIQVKLQEWQRHQQSPLPLADFYTVTSWFGALSGLTLLFTGALQIFNFSALNSLIAGIIVALLTGIPMWSIVSQLLKDVESGNIREIDQFL